MGVNFDYLGEIPDGLLVPAESFIGNASVVQRVRVLRVQLDYGAVVLDGLLIPLQLGKTVRSVVESLNV